ncbi:MAG TPA: tetratricopeptide repeat protein, partial [Pyrinomonadaceae bacterium]|nr:tetratricopeptide repeat protein [Pyrinomonadaceae bacterium]
MSFDKVKAMRNAERFLAQGKIRAAISEYKSIIESDPTDYNTMNMLGDLYVKASEETEAINCFTQVAEHYSKHGFSQKAIAIYNKISRLKPDSLEVSSKLAQLYQSKGSIAEARTHYNTMAEQYSKVGKKAEALMVWKQIANLDPNNTDIYLKIADACWQDNQKNEAAQAYIEAGSRLVIKKQFESAVTAFARALEIRPEDMVAMKGYVDSQVSLGYVDEAAQALEETIEKQPYNRELLFLLIDCYLDMGRVMDAEKITVRLVEQEPSNFPKLLDLVKVYLRNSDLVSAIRPLSMASEHLLVSGQHVKLEGYINEILNKDPEQIDAIRLLVRYHTWQRDEAKIKSSYERLAEAARVNDSIEDEKYALSQLIMIAPQSSYYAQRLHELTASENGYSNNYYHSEVPTFESFQNLTDVDSLNNNKTQNHSEFSEGDQFVPNLNGYTNGHKTEENGFHQEFSFEGEKIEAEIIAQNVSIIEEDENTEFSNNIYESVREEFEEFVQPVSNELSDFQRHNLQKEIEGIEFYVAQGFKDLAEKTLLDIENRFGKQVEIDEARKSLNSDGTELAYNQEVTPDLTSTSSITFEEPTVGFVGNLDEPTTFGQQEFVEPVAEQIQEKEEPKFDEGQWQEPENFGETENNGYDENNWENNGFVEVQQNNSEIEKPSDHLLDDIKSEFGIEDKKENVQEQDFETPFQTGTAYKEMGLFEDSIREFQIAVKMTSPEDGTRRFYWCCN